MLSERPDAGERHALVTSLLRAVRTFGDAHDRMYGDMKHGMHMNVSDLAALRLLIIREDQGRPVSPRDIARHLGISTASTTKLLDRLTESGHVRRVPHPSDRRARVVELTEVARADFYRHFGERLASMREICVGFTDAELLAAQRVLLRLSETMDPDH